MVDTQKFANDPKRPQGPEGALQVGSSLQARYKITGVLGVGGMGSVYLARDMRFPDVIRNVAVKEMLNLASDPTLREAMLKNFSREANILAELAHPAIPKIYDYFTQQDRAYLVMEYINGRDLEGILNTMQDFLPFDMVKKWAIEICDVLQYLHTHEPEPVVFRDVKPSNVMIDSQGKVRLIDFGIAKKMLQNAVGKNTTIGTEGYAPPEQYRGQALPVGDLFALGATLHHLLTRRDPRMEQPFTFTERPIRQINPKVPEEFEKIVMRSLSAAVGDRFPNAAAMRDAILTMDQNVPTVIQVVPGSNSGLVASSQAVPLAADDGFSQQSLIKAIWKFKCEDEIRVTAATSKNIIYVGAYDNNLYALNIADGGFRWKFAADGAIVSAPAVAEEESLVVFGSEDNNLYALDARTGKQAWTFPTGGPIRSSVNIAVGHAFFGSDDGKLYAVRLATGRIAWKVEAGTQIRTRPAVTSERVVIGTEGGEAIGYDLAGAPKWRVRARRAINSSPIIHDNIAYFGSLDCQLYAVDAENGYTAWRARVDKPIIAAPLIVGKMLYVASVDGNLYGLDASSNGRELWRFQTGGQLVSAAVHFNGALYFGSVDKKVYSIDAKKGKLRWLFETEGAIAASPIITDKLVYIGSTDHYLYALNA